MHTRSYLSVLTIAGSDSGGGAGIQADLKTFSSLGCFGTSAITAITVQNTLGVSAIHPVPVEIVQGQIRAVMEDIRPRAIKIGMVHDVALARAIAHSLRDYPGVPVVLDPVMVATSGDRLIEEETIDVLKQELFPLATLVTPNLDEARLLTGGPVRSLEEMRDAARQLLHTGCGAVLVKGGHLKSPQLYDLLLDRAGRERIYTSDFIESNNVHGTGCTLSSAIAALLARGMDLSAAVEQAVQYVHRAIAAGADVRIGSGHGPLNHFFQPQTLLKQ